MKEKLPRVIFEDDVFLVIDKPSGWVVLAENGQQTPLQEWLFRNGKVRPLKNDCQEFRSRMGIAHRLDRGTSGILLVAKDEKTFFFFQRQFKMRKVDKEYLALVVGETPEKGEIVAPVGRVKAKKERFGVIPQGKKAITRFKVEERFRGKGENYSFLRVKIETGRTHQIRVHFRYLGFPLAGDPLYGRKKENFFPRIFLHATKISFRHPLKGKEVVLDSPLPDELKNILTRLRKNQ